jgi:hypothetical protein
LSWAFNSRRWKEVFSSWWALTQDTVWWKRGSWVQEGTQWRLPKRKIKYPLPTGNTLKWMTPKSLVTLTSRCIKNWLVSFDRQPKLDEWMYFTKYLSCPNMKGAQERDI